MNDRVTLPMDDPVVHSGLNVVFGGRREQG